MQYVVYVDTDELEPDHSQNEIVGTFDAWTPADALAQAEKQTGIDSGDLNYRPVVNVVESD